MTDTSPPVSHDVPMRDRARAAVETLQDAICAALEAVDGEGRFREDLWDRPGGGGGRTRVLSDGAVFEKAGVNVSAVYGQLPPALDTPNMPGSGQTFYATGISLVLHPRNPHVPTSHANFRYLERGDTGWFGGGADLTPYVLYEDDARHFHQALADASDATDPSWYPQHKAWCDRYFHLPHRGEARGVGGVFFDHVRPLPEGSDGVGAGQDMETLFAWWKAMGESFVAAYLPIVERRMAVAHDDALRTWQLQRRGRYVEFNLVYDRGTLFGLKTGGRIESILMSLPALVRWDYDVTAQPGTFQEELLAVLREPRDWLGRG